MYRTLTKQTNINSKQEADISDKFANYLTIGTAFYDTYYKSVCILTDCGVYIVNNKETFKSAEYSLKGCTIITNLDIQYSF